MKLKRGFALFLAVVLACTPLAGRDIFADAIGQKAGSSERSGAGSEALSITPASPVTPEEPGGSSMAVLDELEISYQQEEDIVTLSYRGSGYDYVKIYSNGRVLEEEYTGSVYDCTDIEEGKEYLFRVVPYDEYDRAGTGKQASIAIPYKKAVVEDVDADYNLEKQVLIIDWEGSGIACADVYQDDVLIGEKIKGERLILEVKLEAKSRHTYRVVPYNKIDEAGTEKSYLLEVDDYVARIDDCEVEYSEVLRRVTMNWTDSYTQYVEISLNDEVLEERYTGKSYSFSCDLQPGASYILSIMPYNYEDVEGEEDETDLSFGYFDVPDEFKASLVNIPVKSSTGGYTGFSRPSVQLSWQAQKRAVYEIYRAEDKDTRSGYKWIANVKSEIDGVYTYTDEKAGFGNYYYKIRRKIATDTYVEQELYTALSDAERVNVSVPRPTLKAELDRNGNTVLSISSSREYISGYDIYRKCGKGSYKLLATTADNKYTDKATKFGENYHYKVKAYYYDISSGKKTYGKFSKQLSVKNTVSQIQAEAVAVSADTVKISWTPAANVKEYEIYYKSGMQGDSYALWTKTNRLTITRKLKNSGTYYFMIRACQETNDGKSYFSSAEAAVRMGFSAPGGLKISKTVYVRNKNTNALTQKDTLSWNRVYGANGYRIEVYDTATGKYKRIARITTGKKTSCTVSNSVTSDAKTLKYRISAYTKGKVKKGDTIEITPKLGTVENVQVKNSGSKVKVNWNKVTGAERYQVYRSNGRTMLLVGETASCSITDQGLSADINYKYYVQAVNNTKKIAGDKSEPVEITITQDDVSGLKAVNASSGTVKLSWKSSEGAQRYDIYYKDYDHKKYQKIGSVSAKKETYTHTKRTEGSTCYYKIVAVQINSAGIQAESKGALCSVKIKK